MLKSSAEYLNALRHGHYLQFLQWPAFVVAKYNQANSSAQNGDDLIELLVFELLNSGYDEQDAKLVAMLYKAHDAEPPLLPADLDYSLVSIAITVFQCMVYQSTNSQAKFLSQQEKSKQEVIDLMRTSDLEPSLFEATLKEQKAEFSKWVDCVTEEQFTQLLKNIEPMLKLRCSIVSYLDDLEQITPVPDDLRTSRISVVKRLAKYVQEETQLTESVRLEVNTYVAKIRELNPQKEEEDYLINIAPLSIVTKALRVMADLGMLLFDSETVPNELKKGASAEKPSLKIQ